MVSRSTKLQEVYEISAIVQRMMRQCIHQTIDELGLAPSQLQVMQYIEASEPVSLKSLATDMHLTPGAITQLVDSLVRGGYVERINDENDRRVIEATLSPKGKEKIGLLKQKKHAIISKILSDLDNHELEVYLNIQRKMLLFLETQTMVSKK